MRPHLASLVFALVALLPRVVPAAGPAFDPARLGRLDAVIQDHIDRRQLAGAVMYLGHEGRPAHFRAYGQQDIEAGRPMPTDAIFRIASMSKAVTTVAVLLLYEEGRFRLHDPVERHLPAFRDGVVAVPPPPGAPAGARYVTEKVRRPMQILDLLTHTAGLTYGSGLAAEDYRAAGLSGWYFADKDEPLAAVIERLARLPLHAHPGEVYQYGYSTDVLGRLVEVVSGQPLDRFFAERIFAPLGMVDTHFFLPPGKEARLAKVYALDRGVLRPGEQGHYVTGPRKCFSGGAGLLSTARDYARFLQMLLNRGELDGVRLLGRKTVELMQADHLREKFRGDTAGFGLGFWVHTDLGRHGELGSPGAYGWGSAYFPQYLVDPQERLVGLFLTQLMPAGGSDLNQRWKVLMYQALR